MALAIRALSQTEWRSVYSKTPAPARCQYNAALEWKSTGTRTRDSVVPMHLIAISATITSSDVQWLMHIADEMDEELERFQRQLGGCGPGSR